MHLDEKWRVPNRSPNEIPFLVNVNPSCAEPYQYAPENEAPAVRAEHIDHLPDRMHHTKLFDLYLSTQKVSRANIPRR